MQAGGYASRQNLQGFKHLHSFYLQDGSNTLRHTHTDILLKIPAAREGETSWGVAVRWATCTLKVGGDPQCGTCQWWSGSAHSHTRGACAHGGTRVEQSESSGGDQGRGRDPRRLHKRQQKNQPTPRTTNNTTRRTQPTCSFLL